MYSMYEKAGNGILDREEIWNTNVIKRACWLIYLFQVKNVCLNTGERNGSIGVHGRECGNRGTAISTFKFSHFSETIIIIAYNDH